MAFLVGTSTPGCRNCCPPPPPPNDIAAAYPPRPLLGYTPPHRLTPTDVAPIGATQAQAPMPPQPPSAIRSQGLESGPAASSQPDARLMPPEPSRAPVSDPVKPATSEERQATPAPAAAAPYDKMPSMPVGIPQFAGVKDRVSAGLKPMLDGLDWLKSSGYRTVLHIRSPGSDDSADRREIEKRGMEYRSLELSPQTLTPDLLDQFRRQVTDTASFPLFVYDKNGTLAGSVWYLHFRVDERLSDEAARTQAGRLGLKEATSDEERAMWLAIQKYLSSQALPNGK